MSNYRKVFALTICALILSCSCVYAADYHYATRDMTWAEFYAGETNKTSSELESEGLDAVSTATVRFTTRFNATVSSTDDSGSTYTGLKAVQVRMTDAVYESFKDDSRYTFVDGPFTEYKDVNADGSFGKMITETVKAENAKVTLASGVSSSHGDYILNVGIDFDALNLKTGETANSFDYYLGATLETSDGKVYGLRPLYNMWVRTNQLGFSVKDYTERNGTVLKAKYTSDLAGKTIKKITYILKDQADPYVECDLYVKGETTATAEAVYDDGFSAFEIANGSVTAALKVNNAPSDAKYDSIVSISYDDPNGHHGWSTLPADSYTYSDGVLTLTGEIASVTHTYNIVLGDSNNKYIDIGTTFKTFSTDATSLIISGDNLGDVNFLLTPKGAVSSVDAELEKGNFVNASEYTSPDLNHSVPLSGMPNEVEGSGFSFDIALNNLPSDKTAVVGFGKIFYLSPDNCGELYPTIYSAIDKLPAYPSGFKAVDGDMFKSMGLRAMSIRNGEIVDVTSYVGAGAMISDDENIMIFYGVMLADANTGEINEGAVYAFSPEGETTVSDGSRDGHLIAAWYFAIQEAAESDAEVIEDKDNEAGINFTYPISNLAEEKAKEEGLVWVSKEKGNVASGGESDFVKGYTNQIAGSSGITFSIPVDKQKIPEGLSPMVRFESPFTFTASNIGADDFEKLRSGVSALSAANLELKAAADASNTLLKNANIHVIAVYPDETSRDITDLIQCGMKDNGNSITLNYGAIAVDRALTGSEGEKFDTGLEEAPLMSDGLSDGNITVTWYLTHTSSDDGKKDDPDPDPKPAAGFPGSPGGGCDAMSLSSLGLLLAFAFTKLRRK